VARDRLAEKARRRFDGAHRKTWAGAAVRLVNDAFPFESYDSTFAAAREGKER
ncbi:MAG: hypothetical protein GTN69_01725, partial [Armatimonadetes bacterium]|nr:hypothetical protein [Armatimonadota bacterium]